MGTALDVITYTALRENLAKVMDEVSEATSHVIVTRQKSRPVVVMSYEEYRAIAETLHLVANPANASELNASIAQAERGELTVHDLVDPA